jgi:hypothetical protein
MWINFTDTTFSKIKSIKFNKLFIQKLKMIRSEIINTNNVEYTCTITKIPDNVINELKSSFWVSKKLSYDYLPYEVNIKWKNNNIYIKTTEEKFNSFSQRLPIFLKIIDYINKNNNENIKIYMILSNLKKYIDPNKIISVDNINSGYTDISSKVIFIWREEEFEKLCFHEMIHLLDKDHRHETVNMSIDIDGPESFYEAITDFKAILFNVIYLSLVTKIKIKILFSYEYSFIKNQAIYIYNSLKQFKKQESPAYSYFILKYFIFKYFNSDYFNNQLFNEIFYYNKNFNSLIEFIKDYDLNNNNYDLSIKSGRMTLFELK